MQPDQNPDIKVQEEKPESAVKAEKKTEEPKKKTGRKRKQLLKKERDWISAQLKASSIPLKEEAGKKKKTNKKPVTQVSKSEKKEISDMLAGNIKPDTSETVSQPAQQAVTQISDKEKQQILLLLRDGGQDDDVYQELDGDDIDYEHLNKQELVELLEEIVEEKDVSKIKKQVAEIKAAFYQRNKEDIENEKQLFVSGGGEEDKFVHKPDPLEHRYEDAFTIYRRNKSKYAEELEKQKQQNLLLKQQVLENLKELINSEETLKKTYDEFKKLQEEWKQIGMVPAAELSNLWRNYHFLVEKFFDKVKINRELRDLDLRKNMEQKILLCEKTEELLLEKSILNSFKQLQKYHEEWREIGPVPMDKKDELWERFKAATDKINQRRKEYYKEQHDQQLTNYQTKLELIEKVEEIVSQQIEGLKEWQKNTDKINELFKLWKSTGRAPKVKNDEVWAQFKGALDNFYKNKREFFNKLKEEQTNNYNLKLDLCIQAEAIKDSDDWKNTTNKLINLQKEWKKIGPVPRRHSDKVWKRFRAACDHFFNRKGEYFKNVHVVEEENLKKKKEIVKAIGAYKVANDKKKDLDAVKEFQRKWLEIGFVPFKEKEAIQNEYREAIDKLISKLEINKLDLAKSDFKNKIEMLKAAPDADRRLSKERFNIENKIKKIKEDVALLENNIGFFSSSKQSELLKQEFQSKIDKAKKEIGVLKTKLDLLKKEG